jgi:hypothetical protein
MRERMKERDERVVEFGRFGSMNMNMNMNMLME